MVRMVLVGLAGPKHRRWSADWSLGEGSGGIDVAPWAPALLPTGADLADLLPTIRHMRRTGAWSHPRADV
jgi:hypothetical protein